MTFLPTASSLDRVMRCTASHLLPQTQSTSASAERGIVIHAFIERARTIGRDSALDELRCDEDIKRLCAALPLDEMPAGGSHEVALAWNHRTDFVRVLEGDGHRDYSDVTKHEFAGTADYAGVDGDTAIVVDYKTGRRDLGDPHDAWQLRALALMVARLHRCQQARAAFAVIREDGIVSFRWTTFDAFDLDDYADELRALANRLTAKALADTREGDHCTYCKAFDACPAKTKLARAIGNGAALSGVEEQIAAMTSEQLGAVYATLERYDEVAERVRKAIRERAINQPVELPDGRVLGTVQWPATVVNAKVAFDVAKRTLGDDVAEVACPRDATLASIKRAGGKQLLEEIERAGGVVQIRKPQVRVHKR